MEGKYNILYNNTKKRKRTKTNRTSHEKRLKRKINKIKGRIKNQEKNRKKKYKGKKGTRARGKLVVGAWLWFGRSDQTKRLYSLRQPINEKKVKYKIKESVLGPRRKKYKKRERRAKEKKGVRCCTCTTSSSIGPK